MNELSTFPNAQPPCEILNWLENYPLAPDYVDFRRILNAFVVL